MLAVVGVWRQLSELLGLYGAFHNLVLFMYCVKKNAGRQAQGRSLLYKRRELGVDCCVRTCHGIRTKMKGANLIYH